MKVRFSLGRLWGRWGAIVLFLSPWVIIFGLFWLYPFLHSFILSFQKVSRGATEWVGVQNYVKLFSDTAFRAALLNTTIFVVGTIPVTTILALAIAVLINRKIPFQGLFRAGFFFPSIVSMVVIAIIFSNLYSPAEPFHAVKVFLFGRPGQGWLTDPRTALIAVMVMDVWAATGYYVILYLAGLQTIPRTVVEAAEIDGAGPWQVFRNVTLPYLRPITLFIVLINTVRSFQIFIEIFVMTQGRPMNRTTTIVFDLYEKAFRHGMKGYASAAAYVLFVIIMAFSLLQMWAFRGSKGVGE